MNFIKYYKILQILCFLLFSTFAIADCSNAFNTSRIVVAGGSITEIIFSLGQEKNLVGVDVTSKYPLSAKKISSIGYLRNLSSEGILSLAPTLLIAENDIGPPAVLKQLNETSLDIKIIKDNYTMLGIKNKINCVVSILNLNKDNFSLIYDDLLSKINSIEKYKNINEKKNKKALLVLMMRGTSPIIAGKKTSGHGLLTSVGLQNSMADINGWKPVSKEEIILANPDYVIITDRALKGFSSLQDFKSKTGVKLTNAGKNNNIIIDDGMALLGFGPRTLEIGLKISKLISE